MIRITVATLALLLGWCPTASAHDAERTEVTLMFARDGSFVLDVANDPDWLLLRLAPFSSASAPIDSTEPRRDSRQIGLHRDARLRTLAPVFIDRIVLFVDGHEIRPTSVEYLPPRPQTPADTWPPPATYRLRGRMPSTARTLRWYYGIVIDPYPLTIHHPEGERVTEWVAGDAWSRELDLSGQFASRTSDVVTAVSLLGVFAGLFAARLMSARRTRRPTYRPTPNF